MNLTELAKALATAKALSEVAPKPATGGEPPRRSVDGDLNFVRDEDILAASEKLFRDGHYAQAVEEAFKCVNNIVRKRSRHSGDGAGMMKHVFSADRPILRLNRLKTQSEKNEQLGYMEIFSGVMTGVRNPRAHAHQFGDSREDALQLLVLADHLARKAKAARRVASKKK
jgi:uncharacterized protein (TIGR02391 family)